MQEKGTVQLKHVPRQTNATTTASMIKNRGSVSNRFMYYNSSFAFDSFHPVFELILENMT